MVRPVAKFTSWSYSSLKTYEQCPLKAKLLRIDKLKEPDSPAIARGNEAHKACEDYVRAMTQPKGAAKTRRAQFPDALTLFRPEIKEVLAKAKDIEVEGQWAFNDDWKTVDWFAKDAWLRLKLDLAYTMNGIYTIVDYKTGKVRPEEQNPQLALYALCALLRDAERLALSNTMPLTHVRCEFWYLDHGAKHAATFAIADAPGIMKDWKRRIRPYFADRKFPPRANAYCKWCHFGQRGIGKCRF